MISDKKLMTLCLAISLIGIAALFIIVQFIEPRQVKISEINESMAGQNVMINCIVDSITVKDAIFVEVSDNLSINAVALDRNAKEKAMQLKLGDKIILTGKIELYKGELEILINDIKLRYD
ncbi:MAG: hypothetical protein V1900_00300 [Candidatus Aenigmatarchaeota archaeon]